MGLTLSFVVCAVVAIGSVFSAGAQQLPIGVGSNKLDLIYELKKAEIIPTVIDEFIPLLTVSVSWENATAKYGNTINPSKTQEEPKVQLINEMPSLWSKDKVPQLTIAVSDPDAPSRDNPEWSEICHWIATNVELTDSYDDDDISVSENHHIRASNSDIMPYKPPGPPPKTGKHRYVFVALAPKNHTTDKLHLSKPGDRQHWGYKHERDGLRMWAEENGLGVVGANFIYEQNDEQ